MNQPENQPKNTETTIFYGKNIRAAADQLWPVSISRIYMAIARPKPELKSKIERLRAMLAVDLNLYRQLKTQLPYIVCATFSPPVRKRENFAATKCFILDLDHIAENNTDITELKIKLATDPQVALLFASPGGNGIKLLFILSEKIYDPGKYTLLYKVFAARFAKKYNIQTLIDGRTHDVTRACFLSTDQECYFNENAETVKPANFLDTESAIQLQMVKKEISEQEKLLPKSEPVKNELPNEIIAEIRKTLNPNLRTKREKIIFVPEKLSEITEAVTGIAEKNRLEIKLVRDIHYGKQFRFEVGQMWAEINVFYGKKGVTIVKSPKSGSNAELLETVYLLLVNHFY